jgi:hypothetical protein
MVLNDPPFPTQAHTLLAPCLRQYNKHMNAHVIPMKWSQLPADIFPGGVKPKKPKKVGRPPGVTEPISFFALRQRRLLLLPPSPRKR